MQRTAKRRPWGRFWSLRAGITRIEPEAGQQRIYRPGGMESWVLNCTTEGVGLVNRDTEPFQCTPGDILLFPPEVVHDYGREPDTPLWEHRWVDFQPRPTWEEWLQWPHAGNGVRKVTVRDRSVWERIARRLQEVAELLRQPLHHRIDFCLNATEEIILWCHSAASPVGGVTVDPRIDRAVRFMQQHYAEGLGVSALAEQVALSASRFAHLFRQQTGITPMKYLERLRVARAQELLLTTGLSIGEVGYQCGYEEPLYFSHVFRRSVGRSPREFRRGREEGGATKTRTGVTM